jgi:Ca2+-binding RTX toxin-like protein
LAFTTVTGASGAPTTYTGTDGVDLITLVNPGASDLSAEGADDVISINLTAATTTASNQTLRGGQGNDTFNYTSNAGTLISSYIAGNLGNDTFGATGAGLTIQATTLQGGQGNDIINVGAANGGGFVNGNLGNDSIQATQAVAISSTSLLGGQGNDTINIGAATLTGVYISGDLGNDIFTDAADIGAASNAFTISGGEGNDTLTLDAISIAGNYYGGDGNDTILTNTAQDTIDGGAGIDSIDANGDADYITGGIGADTFVQNAGDSFAASATNAPNTATAPVSGTLAWTFGNGVDIITDFSVAEDVIDFGTNGTNTVTAGVANNAALTNTNTALTAGANFIRGTWSTTNSTTQAGTFTYSTTGNDMLVWNSTNAAVSTVGTMNDTAIVLLGAGSDQTAIATGRWVV